jgi:hypothetical protein
LGGTQLIETQGAAIEFDDALALALAGADEIHYGPWQDSQAGHPAAQAAVSTETADPHPTAATAFGEGKNGCTRGMLSFFTPLPSLKEGYFCKDIFFKHIVSIECI